MPILWYTIRMSYTDSWTHKRRLLLVSTHWCVLQVVVEHQIATTKSWALEQTLYSDVIYIHMSTWICMLVRCSHIAWILWARLPNEPGCRLLWVWSFFIPQRSVVSRIWEVFPSVVSHGHCHGHGHGHGHGHCGFVTLHATIVLASRNKNTPWPTPQASRWSPNLDLLGVSWLFFIPLRTVVSRIWEVFPGVP